MHSDSFFSDIILEKIPRSSVTGYFAPIRQIVFLSTGRFASCSDDTSIQVWYAPSCQEAFALNGHTGSVYSIVLLPDGRLASGSQDKTIKVWDIESQSQKREIRTLEGHTGSIMSLKVLSDRNLASYSNDNFIKIWNPYLNASNLLLTFWVRTSVSLGALPKNFLVTYSSPSVDRYPPSTLNVWNSKSGAVVKSIEAGSNKVQTLLVLSNEQVAFGTTDGSIQIIDLMNQNSRIKEKAHESSIGCLLQLSNDNLVSSGQDRQASTTNYSIKVWNFDDLSLLQRIKTDHSGQITTLSVNENETWLASGSQDSTIKLWPIITAS